MDRLWAPWRLSYVAAAKPPGEHDPCFICNGLGEQNDRENLIVWRGSKSVVLLNRFPYNNGHLLVAPNAHKGELAELDADEILQTQQTLARLVEVLRGMIKPDGFNIGLNLGKAAGAGLPGHLHWHIVPRWNGDTNFMSVLTDTRVIVQSLDELYVRLAERFEASPLSPCTQGERGGGEGEAPRDRPPHPQPLSPEYGEKSSPLGLWKHQ